jgi:hypothetical protein
VRSRSPWNFGEYGAVIATMRRALRLFVLGLLVGVGSGSAPARTAPAQAGCTADATKTLVRTFVRDYGGGRIGAADRLWAPAGRFKWFSTNAPGARLGARAYNRGTLAGYFRERARVHETLRLVKLGAGYDPARGIVNFAGRLVRSADDITPRPAQNFKGAADCVSGRPLLIVWSM